MNMSMYFALIEIIHLGFYETSSQLNSSLPAEEVQIFRDVQITAARDAVVASVVSFLVVCWRQNQAPQGQLRLCQPQAQSKSQHTQSVRSFFILTALRSIGLQ